MRITGGSLKGWQIPVKFANHVRPTTDMLREALFNKLSHTFGVEDMVVLDLFSGSGIMALEFLSRGAQKVISVDKDTKNILHQKEIQRQKNLANWEIIKGDVFKYLVDPEVKSDIIFADPPYDLPGIQGLTEQAMMQLNEGGIFILEHRPGILFHGPLIETKKYGSTAISIFGEV